MIKYYLIAVFLLTACGLVQANKEAIPPEPSELADVWIGFDNDELVFTRLDLRSDFTGYCARVSPADTVLHKYGVATYRVSKWGLDRWNMNFNLKPVENNAEPIYLKGHYNGFSLHLKVGNKEHRWERELTLFRETRLDNANSETKKRLRELEKP